MYHKVLKTIKSEEQPFNYIINVQSLLVYVYIKFLHDGFRVNTKLTLAPLQNSASSSPRGKNLNCNHENSSTLALNSSTYPRRKTYT